MHLRGLSVHEIGWKLANLRLGGYLRAYDEEEEESDDDEHGDEPADPIVPGAPVAVSHPISVPTSGHCLSLQVVEVEKRSRLKLFDDAMGR